ncbi:MAG: cysteine--tRNA ligase [Candidatus Margulisiibacteriota bacterium]
MVLKIHNDLTRITEEFTPLFPGKVGMYVCGITPYDETHLGHGRAYVVFDTIRRYLEYSGYEVKHIQNFTDVDDKIIARSRELGVGSKDIAEKNISSYFEVMEKLNVKKAEVYPKATEHIQEMIDWIKGLIGKGIAYQLEGDVYFEIRKFEGYGKLSGRNIDDLLSGARVEVNDKKRSPLDFALWKTAKEGEPSWDSPWGKGRPGWHIECSAMSTKYLGEQFDIHGGGLDLEFPHHENEIAQTEGLTGKIPWVKYWLHNGFVNIDKQKMSKSLGNFFTLKDIFTKYDPMVIRLFLLMTHYRSPINYSDVEIEGAKEAYSRITQFIENIDFILSKTTESAPEVEIDDINEDLISFKDKFKASMDEDFNSAGAVAAIFEMIKYFRKTLAEGEAEKECLGVMRQAVVEMCGILGLELGAGSRETGTSDDVEKLLIERENARKNKDYKKADEIRKMTAEMGYSIEDTPYGAKLVKL